MEKRSKSFLRLSDIQKSFGGVKALKGVGLSLHRGEIHGLVGENGAGKSTLMKILSGVYPHGTYNGKIELNNVEQKFTGTVDAEVARIAIIHQELNLFPNLSVAENIYLTRFPWTMKGIDFQKLEEKANKILNDLEAPFNAKTLVEDLRPGEQQLVEIAKAISMDAQILILDEPTSSLSLKETQRLFSLLKDFRKKGMGLIYISHKLEEIFELSDNISVLRDGESVANRPKSDWNEQTLVSMMVGRALGDFYPPLMKAKSEEVIFSVKNLKAVKRGKEILKGVSFELFRGEILGISGLSGAGRTDIFLALFGHEKYEKSAEVRINGQSISMSTPQEAINAGLMMLSEDRKGLGLHLEHSICHNVSLANYNDFFRSINLDKENKEVEEILTKLKTKYKSIHDSIQTLSGGNQQKVSLAKWLLLKPTILLLDEPTRGVDVGAKLEIYQLLTELVKIGIGIVVVSSELPELLGLCNRIYTMKNGQLSRYVQGKDRTAENIMRELLT